MKVSNKNILIIAFAVIAIIFGNLFLLESSQVNRLNREVEQLNYEAETLKESLRLKPIPGEFPDEGSISIQEIGNFHYLRIKTLRGGDPIDNEIIFRNVTFIYLGKETMINTIFRSFDVTFQDDSSEKLMTFHGDNYFETKVKFTEHNNPKAGWIFIPEGGVIYLLVSQ